MLCNFVVFLGYMWIGKTLQLPAK